MKKSTKRPARRLANPAARGTGTIVRAIKKIEREVGEYAGQKAADAAVKALILVVPLKTNIGEHKKTIKEHLLRERGESDRKYVIEALKGGKPGAYVRASDIAEGNYIFEGDLCLIRGGNYGGTEHGDQILTLRPSDLVISKATAIDGNMEEFPVAKVADAIIQAYAFGEENRGRGPWIVPPSKRDRY